MKDFQALKQQSDTLPLLAGTDTLDSGEKNRWQGYQQSAVLTYAGRMLALRRDWGRAMEKFARAVEFAPLDPVAGSWHRKAAFEYHVEVGRNALQQKDFFIAIEHLKQAVGLQPDNAEGHFQYGLALLASSRRHEEEGVKHLLRALKLNPRHWRADINLALYYGRQKQWKLAAVHMSKALHWQPDLLKYYPLETQQEIRENWRELHDMGYGIDEP